MIVLTARPRTKPLALNKTNFLRAPQIYVANPGFVFHQKVEIPNNQSLRPKHLPTSHLQNVSPKKGRIPLSSPETSKPLNLPPSLTDTAVQL
jgi:hypothetical protein